MNITNTLLFLLIKCEDPLPYKGFSHCINQKITSVYAYVVGIYLTNRGLNDDVKLNKVLNNWALVL